MTREEALAKHKEFKKIDIRNRLHKYNPAKYPKPVMYSAIEAFNVAWILSRAEEKINKAFKSDNTFFNAIRSKELDS